MSALALTRIGVLSLLALIGSYQDIRFRRLPNWLCLITLITGLVLGWITYGADWAAMSALHAVAALVAGMILFAMQVVGGGDAKFYAALAAWMPLAFSGALAITIALAGFVLLIVWFSLRSAMASSPRRGGNSNFRKLPYGVAIASGAVIVSLLELLGQFAI
ncbi:MAG: prepilin peptidase [Novosphingobium sp.]